MKGTRRGHGGDTEGTRRGHREDTGGIWREHGVDMELGRVLQSSPEPPHDGSWGHIGDTAGPRVAPRGHLGTVTWSRGRRRARLRAWDRLKPKCCSCWLSRTRKGPGGRIRPLRELWGHGDSAVTPRAMGTSPGPRDPPLSSGTPRVPKGPLLCPQLPPSLSRPQRSPRCPRFVPAVLLLCH